MESYFTVIITSSDEFDAPSLTAEDVKNALQAKAIEEDVSVEAWARVQP